MLRTMFVCYLHVDFWDEPEFYTSFKAINLSNSVYTPNNFKPCLTKQFLKM